MATYVCQRLTAPLEGFGFSAQEAESVVVRARDETEARAEAARILRVPEHDIRAVDLASIPL